MTLPPVVPQGPFIRLNLPDDEPIDEDAVLHLMEGLRQTPSVEGAASLSNFASLTTRERLTLLENDMAKLPQRPLHVDHIFSPGIYTRALHIPKGTLLTGKIHKQPILNIMMMGDISVLLGNDVVRIRPPFVTVSPPGSKKIGYAHEDTIWMGCHATTETDIEKLEAEFVTMSEDDFREMAAEFTAKLVGEEV